RRSRRPIQALRGSWSASATMIRTRFSATRCGMPIVRLERSKDWRVAVTLVRKITTIYAVVLTLAALTNYLPGLTDAQGRAFGIFALDIYDDALHLVSATWAAVAASRSTRASTLFLRLFGTLYLLDGLMGLATGSGYLDLGILTYGVQHLPFGFKILANLPHLALGGLAVFAGFALALWQ